MFSPVFAKYIFYFPMHSPYLIDQALHLYRSYMVDKLPILILLVFKVLIAIFVLMGPCIGHAPTVQSHQIVSCSR